MMALSSRGRAARVPFTPSEEWIEAFTRQMSEPAFFHAMWRYAERRGRMLAHVARLDPEAYAQGLVQDVIDDTLEGTIAWDPQRVTLAKHVRDAVKSRSRHQYRRALRDRHVSLDGKGALLVDDATAVAHRETAAEQAERARCVAAVLERIRASAGDDVEVVKLLDAMERGAETRGEILHVAGLTKLQYDAARKRLDRLIETLPSQLITHALRSR